MIGRVAQHAVRAWSVPGHHHPAAACAALPGQPAVRGQPHPELAPRCTLPGIMRTRRPAAGGQTVGDAASAGGCGGGCGGGRAAAARARAVGGRGRRGRRGRAALERRARGRPRARPRAAALAARPPGAAGCLPWACCAWATAVLALASAATHLMALGHAACKYNSVGRGDRVMRQTRCQQAEACEGSGRGGEGARRRDAQERGRYNLCHTCMSRPACSRQALGGGGRAHDAAWALRARCWRGTTAMRCGPACAWRAACAHCGALERWSASGRDGRRSALKLSRPGPGELSSTLGCWASE